MARRSIARETALKMLYQLDLNSDVNYGTVREQIREMIGQEDLVEFAWYLFVGVMEHRATLDEKIQKTTQNWSVKRMAPTDRNTLRLGAYELLYTNTPPRVVIDEALELAKMFGSSQSGQFVNGILDRLIPADRRPEKMGPIPAASDDSAEVSPTPESTPAS